VFGSVEASTYEAFESLLKGKKYKSVREVEKRLYKDRESLQVLCTACRESAKPKGAWNLLLLGLSRPLAYRERMEDLDALLESVVLAVESEKDPVYLIREKANESRKRRGVRERAEWHYSTWMGMEGSLTIEVEKGDKVWTQKREADPLLRERLEATVGKLREEEQEIFWRRAQGATHQEIGQHFGFTKDRARMRYHRVRTCLQDSLADLWAKLED
jgi:Sigma-70, region 4